LKLARAWLEAALLKTTTRQRQLCLLPPVCLG
jgi:hypothetical protein